MKKVFDNSIKRFVKTAVAMAEKATTMKELERLYNSGRKYQQFIGDRMGTGFYSQQRYADMWELASLIATINSAVESHIERVQQLEKVA